MTVFKAVVTKVESITQFSGRFYKTHFAVSFVVHVNVISGEPPFEPGSEHAIGIHSVVQTFFGDPVGRLYEFRLTQAGNTWKLAQPTDVG
jgi:hypothetical protein